MARSSNNAEYSNSVSRETGRPDTRLPDRKSNRPQCPMFAAALSVAVIACVIATTTGCKNIFHRGQSPQQEVAALLERDVDDDTKYISENCSLWGLNMAVIHGVGLVVGLDGTGSEPGDSNHRKHLLHDLRTQDIDDPKAMVASEDTAMVLVKAILPPGIREGEPYDLEITALTKSDTKSLSGGYLIQNRLRPMALMGRSIQEGHVLGYGRGEVLTDSLFETRDDQPNQLRGLVLGGGKAAEDRKIGLALRSEQSIRTSTAIAKAINARFTAVGRDGRKGVANPQTDKLIELEIPDEYRLNVGRYGQLIMSIAYDESTEDQVNRLSLLSDQLLNPATAETAALRLEALGKIGLPALKRGLKQPDAEVKFHAAQALAYMGEVDGIEHLKLMAAGEPAFRWHALTALASLDDIASGAALSDLMQERSAEARYGAYRAMLARSPDDPIVAGQHLAGSFYFSNISSDTADPILHFSRTRRPEIVCFGELQVSEEFLFVETGLTIKGIGNNNVRITKYDVGDKQQTTCSANVTELIQTLAAMDYGYETMLKMFRDAKQKGDLSGRLVVNAVPRLTGSQERELIGDYEPEQSSLYVSGPVPQLFAAEGRIEEREVPRVGPVGNPDEPMQKRESESRFPTLEGLLDGLR